MTKKEGLLLDVLGIRPGEIAYNPAAIVQKNRDKIAEGANIVAARIESLHSNWLNPKLYDPHIQFFTRKERSLVPIPNTPIFYQAEDPWATWLTGKNGESQLLFGFVKVDFDNKAPVITTQLYLASSVQELRVDNPVAEIREMKDVRVTQLRNGKIAVFTRPTTGEAYPGRVGFALIDTIQQIEKAANAPLLTFQVDKDAKIGVNEAYEDGDSINVFCHVATTDPINEDGQQIFDFERGIIHYAGYSFSLDPNHPFDKTIDLRKVADRSDFPANNKFSKGSRFNDVIFPGGTGGPGQTQYYCGVEDARIGVIDMS